MTEPKDYNIDEILIDLAHKSNHLSERYEFEESILHKGTHLSNAKAQLFELITKETEIYPEKGIGSIRAVRAVPIEAINHLFNIKETN